MRVTHVVEGCFIACDIGNEKTSWLLGKIYKNVLLPKVAELFCPIGYLIRILYIPNLHSLSVKLYNWLNVINKIQLIEWICFRTFISREQYRHFHKKCTSTFFYVLCPWMHLKKICCPYPGFNAGVLEFFLYQKYADCIIN